MVEFLVASAFVAAGVVAVARRSTTAVDGFGRDQLRSPHDTDGADLPCPWCRAATGENDQRCPSCGQRFG